MENKLYILFFDSVFSWKHKPWLIMKPIIKFFTQSKFNHVADNYTSHKRGKYVNEAIGKGFTSNHYTKVFADRYCKLIAYEVIVPIDFDKWHKKTKEMIGMEYGAAEAVFTVIDRVPVVNWIYRKVFDVSNLDNDIICSSAVLVRLQDQGYLLHLDSENISPEELKKEMLEYRIIRKVPILVWNKMRIKYNIFT